jgi:quercetin dioxygenase-like cupin family protein
MNKGFDETIQKTMQAVPGVTERRSLTLLKIGLLSLCGICISVAVALATPGSGFLSNIVSRATVGAFQVESESGPWQVEIETSGISDIVTQTVTLGPGGFSGWHSHPGPAIVSVKSGTVTFYEGNDPSCTPHVFSAGTGFVEPGGDIHIARNEGTTDLTLNVTYIVPQNAPQRIDQPASGNCPF